MSKNLHLMFYLKIYYAGKPPDLEWNYGQTPVEFGCAVIADAIRSNYGATSRLAPSRSVLVRLAALAGRRRSLARHQVDRFAQERNGYARPRGDAITIGDMAWNREGEFGRAIAVDELRDRRHLAQSKALADDTRDGVLALAARRPVAAVQDDPRCWYDPGHSGTGLEGRSVQGFESPTAPTQVRPPQGSVVGNDFAIEDIR